MKKIEVKIVGINDFQIMYKCFENINCKINDIEYIITFGDITSGPSAEIYLIVGAFSVIVIEICFVFFYIRLTENRSIQSVLKGGAVKW